MYNSDEIDFKILVGRFTNYLRFYCVTGNNRVTNKYKFPVFYSPSLHVHSPLRKIEIENLEKWFEYENERN